MRAASISGLDPSFFCLYSPLLGDRAWMTGSASWWIQPSSVRSLGRHPADSMMQQECSRHCTGVRAIKVCQRFMVDADTSCAFTTVNETYLYVGCTQWSTNYSLNLSILDADFFLGKDDVSDSFTFEEQFELDSEVSVK